MPVIALTQEMGSLAKDVAVRLAQVAQLQVMRNEVLDNVAGRMHVAPSLVRRVREGQAGLRERRSTDPQAFALYSAEEVFAQAERGNNAAAANGVNAFVNQVDALEKSGRLSSTNAADLRARAEQVLERLRA